MQKFLNGRKMPTKAFLLPGISSPFLCSSGGVPRRPSFLRPPFQVAQARGRDLEEHASLRQRGATKDCFLLRRNIQIYDWGIWERQGSDVARIFCRLLSMCFLDVVAVWSLFAVKSFEMEIWWFLFYWTIRWFLFYWTFAENVHGISLEMVPVAVGCFHRRPAVQRGCNC